MKFSKIIPLVLFILISTIILQTITPNTKAATAEIIINMDEHDIIVYQDPNASNFCYYYVSGNVSCQFDNFGENVQHIDVTLWTSDEYNWEPKAAPNHLVFHQNGKYSINLSIRIRTREENNSKNLITIGGYWQTDPYSSGMAGGSGQAKLEKVNVTFIRGFEYYKSEPELSDYDKSPDEGNYYHWLTIFILIGLPIIIVVTIIVLVARRVHEWYIWDRYRSK